MEHAGSIKKYQSFATAAAAGAPADADDAAAATAAADAFTAAVSQIKSCFGTYGVRPKLIVIFVGRWLTIPSNPDDPAE